jgi:hypothetical protein
MRPGFCSVRRSSFIARLLRDSGSLPELPTYRLSSQISMTLGANHVSSTGGNLFRLVCLRYGLQAMRDLSTIVGVETGNVDRLDRLRESRVPAMLYPRLFGVAWSEIDTALRRMHCNCDPVQLRPVSVKSQGVRSAAHQDGDNCSGRKSPVEALCLDTQKITYESRCKFILERSKRAV